MPKRNRDRESKRDNAQGKKTPSEREEALTEMPPAGERARNSPPSFAGSAPPDDDSPWFRRDDNARRNDG